MSGAANAAVQGPFTLEPVRAIAAHATAIAAIVGPPAEPAVLLLTRDRPGGPVTVVGRWPEGAPPPGADDRVLTGKQRLRSDIDDTLWLYGLSDAERDSWLLEELLESEGLDEASLRRRTPPPNPRPVPRALAAGGSELWVASSQGVWRLEGTGPAARWQPRGLAGRDVAQIAVAGDERGLLTVTAVTGGTIWRSRDGGERWEPAGVDRSVLDMERRAAVHRGRPPGEVTAVAIAGDEVWLGSRHGLYLAALEDDLEAWSAAGFLHAAGAESSDLAELSARDESGRRRPKRPAWTRYLPHVSLELGTGQHGPRQELRALIIVTLPLQRAVR